MSPSTTPKSANVLFSIFAILTLFLCTGGYIYYKLQKKIITIEKHNELAAVSKLKIDQIASWRSDRMSHARTIFNNQAIIKHIHEYYIGINQNESRQTIGVWIKSLLKESEYSKVLLVDPSNKIVLNANTSETLSETDNSIISQSIEHKDIVMSDLCRDKNQIIYIDIAIPLYTNSEKHEGFSGVALLCIDPEKYLYPLIESWPTPSRTSETMLIRREGDSVLYLSEVQYSKNATLRLRKPLTDTLLPASRAVTGFTGIMEGTDYKGVKVLADVHPVPDSNWYIVAKVDADEIYLPIRKQAFWIFTFTFLLVFVSGLIIYTLWKQHLVKSERDRQVLLQHFDYLVKYANDIIILSNFNGKIFEVNEKAISTYGYTRHEILKLNMIQLRPLETKSTLNQQLKLLNGKDGHIYETFHIRKNGEKFPVEVSGRIMNVKGKKYYQGIIRDISERKQAEEALQEREQDLLIAQKLAHVGSWSFNHETMQPIWSEEMYRIWGLNPKNEAPNYEEHRKLIHPNDWQQFDDAVKDALENGNPYNLELRILRPDGEERTIILICVPQLDKEGKVIKLTGTTQDITERKRVEEVINNMNVDLELRVTQRTLQLENANKELEAFSYSVSHDLRAPLRNIDGWSLVLLEERYDQLDVEGRQYLSRVRNETQRMGHLIDDLLKLARVTRNEIKKVSVDLTAIAQDIANRLQDSLPNRRLDFIIQPGLTSFGDPQMLDIAITNLFDNACKFTNKQSMSKIEFGQSVINDKQTFWVKDNGVGFDMAFSKNLFNAFQRLHKQSEFPGSGVGLATVQRIIRCHDGLIWAESKLNQGATFYFTLKEETR